MASAELDTDAVRLPAVLDDEQVERRRAELTAVAADPSVAHVVLDAVDLRSVSARGLGLLAGLRLRAARRGVGLCVIRSTPATAAAALLARLHVCGIDSPDASLHVRCPGVTAGDATPAWWTGAAANA